MPPAVWTEPTRYGGQALEDLLDAFDIADHLPSVGIDTPIVRQPFHLILWAEKSSAESMMVEFAERFDASVIVGTGETGDGIIYEIAKACVADGRPARLFVVADCDPSGWQMPISIARKLQALRDQQFAELQIDVIRVGLTPTQVKAFNAANPGDELPSSLIKEGESRGGELDGPGRTPTRPRSMLCSPCTPRCWRNCWRRRLAPTSTPGRPGRAPAGRR